MKTKFLSLAVALLTAGSLITSCKKDNSIAASTTTSTSNAALSFGVKTDNSVTTLSNTALAVNSNSSSSSSSAVVTWTSGTANISGFKLEAKRHNTEIEIRSTGMANIDLFAITPPLISAVIDTGLYTNIEVRVEFSKTSGANIPLTLKGTITLSGNTVPIEFDFNDDAELKVEAQNVTVDGTQDLTTFVDIHLNKLLTSVSTADLSSANLSGGTLIISSTTNTNIYNKIKSNIGSIGDSNGFDKHDKSGKDR